MYKMYKTQSKTQYKCIVCNKVCLKLSSIILHVRCHLPNRFLCPECGLYFGSAGSLANHRNAHRRATKFSCKHCNLWFQNPGSLENHVLTAHEKLDPFRCKKCLLDFRSAVVLQKHTSLNQCIINMEKKPEATVTVDSSSMKVKRYRKRSLDGNSISKSVSKKRKVESDNAVIGSNTGHREAVLMLSDNSEDLRKSPNNIDPNPMKTAPGHQILQLDSTALSDKCLASVITVKQEGGVNDTAVTNLPADTQQSCTKTAMETPFSVGTSSTIQQCCQISSLDFQATPVKEETT